jgi:PAS domain S-box-containing protein
VLAAAALIAVVSVLTFGVLLKGLQDQRDTAARARGTTDALNTARELQRLALTMESDARGYQLTRSDDFRIAFQRARDAIPPAAAKLARTESDPAQRAEIARVQGLLESYARYLDGAIAGADGGVQDTTRFNAIDSALSRYTAEEAREQLRARADSNRLRNRAVAIAAGGLVLLLALIALISFGAVRAVVGPVQRLQRFARDLGGGHFSARLPETGPPETAELERVFNETAERLGRMRERHLAELDAVFLTAPLGLAFLDSELRVLRVNDALAEMRGMPADELVGTPVDEVVDTPELLPPLREVARTGEPALDMEFVVRDRTVLVSYFPVRGDDGALLAIGVALTDITARRRAERARERLQSATAALAAASTVDEVAAATVAEIGRVLGTSIAAVFLLDPTGESLHHVRGLGGGQLERWATIPLRAQVPLTAAVNSGEASFFRDNQSLLEGLTDTRDADMPAFAALPLVASGRALGVLGLQFTRPMEFDADERALLLALASQSAIAFARAQLYEREHTVAQTLQASLLPRALPAIEGLDLAGRLEAGAAGVEVGGDFYDAFAIADGVWGVAIGDVCGKGVDAAALTALARHTVRAAAHEQTTPAGVLEALNRAVLAESRPGQFLTAIFARLTALPDGRFGVVFACGGHPPPVLLDAGSEPRPLNCAGTLLGVVEDPELVDCRAELEPGDTLLLYTDGLTEAGAPTRTLTTEEVAEMLAAVRGETASQTAEGCLREALAASGGVTRDDIAVLVAQVGLAMMANRGVLASTAGRTAAGESSTRGQ